MKAGEHGPDEIYDKFTVVKSKHVTRSINGLSARFQVEDELTHKEEWIFVIRPDTDDQAALAALATYARVCAATYPRLAEQIEEKLRVIRRRELEGPGYSDQGGT